VHSPYCVQVASGLERLHTAQPAPLLHGDLKSSNVLLQDDGAGAVIADFGLACVVPEDTNCSGSTMSGPAQGTLTISTSPPEVLFNPLAPRSLPVDIYALGVVMYEMLSGHQAFVRMPRNHIIMAVMAGHRPPLPSTLHPEAAALIRQCWAQEPGARPQIRQVVTRLAALVHSLAETRTLSTTTTE
jgi:serine/threonine protein kinase